MRLEELKKGLLGYKKDAVFQYISQLEEQFMQKMAEKDAQIERASRQDRSRIQDLEQENRALKEELTRLRTLQDQISQAILDARSSAEMLKAESRALEEKARATVRQTLEQDLVVLDDYRQKIANLHRAIQTAMKDLEQQTEKMERQVEELLEAAPQENLTLFQ